MSQGFFQPYLTWFHDFLQCFCIFDTIAPRTEIQRAPSVKTHLALSPREIQGDNSSRCTRSGLLRPYEQPVSHRVCSCRPSAWVTCGKGVCISGCLPAQGWSWGTSFLAREPGPGPLCQAGRRVSGHTSGGECGGWRARDVTLCGHLWHYRTLG